MTFICFIRSIVSTTFLKIAYEICPEPDKGFLAQSMVDYVKNSLEHYEENK